MKRAEEYHSHRRATPRPKHVDIPRYWIPTLGEWLTLDEMTYRRIREGNYQTTNEQMNAKTNEHIDE